MSQLQPCSCPVCGATGVSSVEFAEMWFALTYCLRMPPPTCKRTPTEQEALDYVKHLNAWNRQKAGYVRSKMRGIVR